MNTDSLNGAATFLGVFAALLVVGILAGIGWFAYRYAKVRNRDLSGMDRLKLESVIIAKEAQDRASAAAAIEVGRGPEEAEVAAPTPVDDLPRRSKRTPSNPDALPRRSLR